MPDNFHKLQEKEVENYRLEGAPSRINEGYESIASGEVEQFLESFLVPEDLGYVLWGETDSDEVQGLHEGRTTTVLDPKGDIKTVDVDGKEYCINIKGCGSIYSKEEEVSNHQKDISDGYFIQAGNSKVEERLKEVAQEGPCLMNRKHLFWPGGYSKRPFGGHRMDRAKHAFRLSSDDVEYGEENFKLKGTEDFYIAPTVAVSVLPEEYDKLLKDMEFFDMQVKHDRDSYENKDFLNYNEEIGQEVRLLPTNARLFDKDHSLNYKDLAKNCKGPEDFEKLLSNAIDVSLSFNLLRAQTLREREKEDYENLKNHSRNSTRKYMEDLVDPEYELCTVQECNSIPSNSVCGFENYAFVDLESLFWVPASEEAFSESGSQNRFGLFDTLSSDDIRALKYLVEKKYQAEGEDITNEEVAEDLMERISDYEHPCLEDVYFEDDDEIKLEIKALNNPDFTDTESIRKYKFIQAG